MSDRFHPVLVKEASSRDCYDLKSYPLDFFDYVIDIGAAKGTTSLMCSIMFSKASIFAYEPFVDTFNVLSNNLGFLSNVTPVCKALGNGTVLHSRGPAAHRTTKAVVFREEPVKGSIYQTDSISFQDILEAHKIDLSKKVLLKIDCEGGERFLMNTVATDLMKQCHHIILEVHWPVRKGHFVGMPAWNEYNTWIRESFGETHSISYRQVDKRMGSAVYVMRRKNG